MRPGAPPRLPSFNYVGLHRYLLTTCTAERRAILQTADLVGAVKARLFQACAVEGFSAMAYCFMPDHCHVLLLAGRDDSSFRSVVRRFKQTSSFDYSRDSGKRLWQAGYHDHVLHSDEATVSVAKYVLANPVRAGLVQRFEDYPFSGSQQFTMRELAELWDLRT